jgi:hypothetical protein
MLNFNHIGRNLFIRLEKSLRSRKRTSRHGPPREIGWELGVVNLKILRRAIAVGVMFELLLVVAAHYRPWLKHAFLMFCCMLIAGVAGLLYARDLARGFRAGALGGGAVGASCGVVAVAVSNILGDRPDLFSPWGVMVLTFTGIVGGLFGQLDALFKAFIRSQK